MQRLLAVYRCPTHRDFKTLVLHTYGGSGVRLFGGKCCQSQYAELLVAWHLNEKTLMNMIEELQYVLEAYQEAPKK